MTAMKLATLIRPVGFITLSLLLFVGLSSVPQSVHAQYNRLSAKSLSEKVVNHMKHVGANKQMILVSVPSQDSSHALVQTFERNGQGKWIRKLSIPGIIGKYGLTRSMHEGSKKSPAGKFTITRAFGRHKNPGTKLSYHRIKPTDVWVDNVHSRYYNTLQNSRKVHLYSEKMNIPQYDYGFVINYNTSHPKRGAGSAIFFHINGRYGYTLGCTAVSKSTVVKILKWLNPKKQPIIIQDTVGKLAKMQHY